MAKVTVKKSNITSKSAKEAAYGKQSVTYKNPKKPEKGSETYEYGDKKTRNTKFYDSTSDRILGTMSKTLKSVGLAKEKNLTDKEAKALYEGMDPKAKGKDHRKSTMSNVAVEAHRRVSARAKATGLSEKDAAKAKKSGIVTTAAGLKSDRDKIAMRFKMQESKKKKAAQDKIKRGY